jgi:SAM-dependent methyltransferase
VTDPYAGLASDYHWLYDAFSMRVGTRTPGVQAAIAALPRGARVLDAACGVGIDAASLHRRGFDVVAADASPAMVEECRRRLAGLDPPVPVVGCRWEELPDSFGPEFDAVLCTGNSLAHTSSRADRRAALAGLVAVLRPGGTAILDSHDWPVVQRRGSRVDEHPLPVTRDGATCRRTDEWRVPESPADPIVLVIELWIREDDRERRVANELTFHPFTPEELVEDVRAAGVADVEVVTVPDDDRFSVLGRRPAR